jgi:hypothetical protein
MLMLAQCALYELKGSPYYVLVSRSGLPMIVTSLLSLFPPLGALLDA